jgi:hypothetical protein
MYFLYVMYYASLLRQWHPVMILVWNNRPFKGGDVTIDLDSPIDAYVNHISISTIGRTFCVALPLRPMYLIKSSRAGVAKM